VIDHETLRTDAARSWTWISASLSQACSVVAALGIYSTLGSTVRGVTDVILQTGARRHARIAAVAASGEWPARGWNAGIRWCQGGVFVHFCERIASEFALRFISEYRKTFSGPNEFERMYLRSWKHVTKGSPVKPALQLQIGL